MFQIKSKLSKPTIKNMNWSTGWIFETVGGGITALYKEDKKTFSAQTEDLPYDVCKHNSMLVKTLLSDD